MSGIKRKKASPVFFNGSIVRIVEFNGKSAAITLDILSALHGEKVKVRAAGSGCGRETVLVIDDGKWTEHAIVRSVKEANALAQSNAMTGVAFAKLLALAGEHVGIPMEDGTLPDFEHVYEDSAENFYAAIEAAEGPTKEEIFAEYETVIANDKRAAKKAKMVAEEPRKPVKVFDAAEVAQRAIEVYRLESAASTARNEALERTRLFKMRHAISRLDHADPEFQAFTVAPFGEYQRYRALAAKARSRLRTAVKNLAATTA